MFELKTNEKNNYNLVFYFICILTMLRFIVGLDTIGLLYYVEHNYSFNENNFVLLWDLFVILWI